MEQEATPNSDADDRAPWRERSRRLIHKGAKFNVESITLEDARGRPLTREVVRHPGAVVVVPILEAGIHGRVIAIRNWRHSVGQWLWEFPAGTLEAGEDPAACAARELSEETGYQAATIHPLGRFHTSPGLTDELMWVFSAMGLVQVGQRLEQDERIQVRTMRRSQVLELIDSGDLRDAKSLAAWLLADRNGLLA